jgi:hypothetical protein
MSPEATLIFLLVAFVAFVVGALASWYPDGRGYVASTFWVCTGLAAWVFVSLWAAIKAL